MKGTCTEVSGDSVPVSVHTQPAGTQGHRRVMNASHPKSHLWILGVVKSKHYANITYLFARGL